MPSEDHGDAERHSERRLALNEAAFRAVNERIERLTASFASPLRTMAIVCECGDGGCIEQIEITVSAYERVRSDGRQFIVVPGHDLPGIEAVVAEGPGYDVVRKREGTPAETAELTDPRPS